MSFEKLMEESNPFELYENDENFSVANERLKKNLKDAMDHLQELRSNGAVINGESAIATVFNKFRALSRDVPDVGQDDTASREAIEYCIAKALEPKPAAKLKTGPSF